VVNPDSWLTGSALFTYVMLANPQVAASYSADVYDPFIEQGRSIQKFFRSLAFDERGKLQRVLIANMLRMYEQKMRDAAVAFESYLKVLPQLPLKSLDQELPEEIVSDEERARVAEANPPFRRDDPHLPVEMNAPRNAVSYVQDERYFVDVNSPPKNRPRLSDPGRGVFGPVEGKAKPALLSEPVHKCPDYTHHLPWPTNFGIHGNTPEFEYYRPRWTIPDNGLHWDTSLLPLIPRAALWADRVLEGGKLVACVSNQFTQLYFHYGFFRYDVAIEVRVEFEATIRIADKSGKRRFRVATLKARMKPSYPTGDMKGGEACDYHRLVERCTADGSKLGSNAR
jgi:hypothetical protein